MEIKCGKCDLFKDRSEFYTLHARRREAKYTRKWKGNVLGRLPRDYATAWCKTCKKVYDRERRKNPDVLAREKACHVKDYTANYPKYWAQRQAARAHKYGVIGLVSWEEWGAILTAHDNKCHWCQRELHVSFLTLDHVKPLSEGGAHDKTNVVPACANCNHVRLWELKVKHHDIDRSPLSPTEVA